MSIVWICWNVTTCRCKSSIVFAGMFYSYLLWLLCTCPDAYHFGCQFTVYLLHLIHSWLGCKKPVILLACDNFSLKHMSMTWFILTDVSFDIHLLCLIHGWLGCKQTRWCSWQCSRHRAVVVHLRWPFCGAQRPVEQRLLVGCHRLPGHAVFSFRFLPCCKCKKLLQLFTSLVHSRWFLQSFSSIISGCNCKGVRNCKDPG